MKNVKRRLTSVLVLLVLGLIPLLSCNTSKSDLIKSSTTLEITNNSTMDSVLTYLTLGADTNYITDVNGIFGITDSGLMGSFWMLKDSIYTYEFDSLGISGNISFNTPPLNCPTNDFANGVNLFEFTLNNVGINPKGQETIDISNVAGANAYGKFSMTDTNWIAGGKKVLSFHNDSLYGNYSNVGVYPFKCDTCTGSQSPPTCKDTLNGYATPKESHDCNVSRNSKLAGGKVRITFSGLFK
jgi:hypothetical protein